MKKIFTLLTCALCAASVWAATPDTLNISNVTNPATIEYGDNGVWTGTYSESYPWLTFGNFMLSHVANGATYGGYYWDGFTISKNGDQTDYGVDESGTVTGSTNWVSNAWGCMAGGGIKRDENGVIVANDGVAEADKSQPYFPAYWGYYTGATSQTNIVKFTDGATHIVNGAYVCNSPWPYYSTIHGDGFARAFAAGDAFTLYAIGLDAEGNVTDTATFKLIYYDTELHAVNDWTYFDLSSLGEVASFYFTITSTDSGDYGNNTSNSFCLGTIIIDNDLSGINDVVVGEKEVASTTYMNLSGVESNEPFDGINIVVTHYTDGTTTTSKVIK